MPYVWNVQSRWARLVARGARDGECLVWTGSAGLYTASAILSDATSARSAVRAARAKAHPDAGGVTNDFTLVQEAARVLGTHHGVQL